MKKLMVMAVLAVVAYGGWRWQHSEPVDHKPNILFNRFWIDHAPQGEKDTVRVFALWRPESFGVFADQNLWRVELERFRYEAQGDEVHAIFPLSGNREHFTAKATRCHEADWDFCLDVTGSSHGVTRYYSRLGWERHDRSVEEFVGQLYEH
jgi:hypothetical protein